ncbi:MAG: transcriptional regulatory protein [Pseudonocardiales bacterium]|nr:transcriptional regulatory protein [Jatrophihabitantaceae bacterium]MCW2603705.1 transcriptional regulatory protein [Pseudonocardiales bacterium]
MSAPLYKLKAEFFRTLGHPARIRVLELLSASELSVGDLLMELGLEASHLSQQLAVLRRAGVVTARKEGSSVIYAIASPAIADLLMVARRVLAGLLDDQVEKLSGLRDDVLDRSGATPPS